MRSFCVPSVRNSGLRREKLFFKGGKAPSEAVSGPVTSTTAAAILYAGLAGGVLEEKGHP